MGGVRWQKLPIIPHHSWGSFQEAAPIPVLSGAAAGSMLCLWLPAVVGGRPPLGVPLLPQQPWAELGGGLSWEVG